MVLIISGAKNFQSVASQITPKHLRLLQGLFKGNDGNNNELKNIKFDPYIVSAFNLFKQSKKHLIMAIWRIVIINKLQC